MRSFVAIVLLLLSYWASAQIKVVDADLFGVGEVQLIVDGKVIAISNDEGILDISMDSLPSKFALLHQGFHPKAVQKPATPDEEFVVLLTRKTAIFDPVIVRPNRTGVPRNDVALNLDAIGSKSIQLFQPATTAEVLGINNTVYVQKSQAGGGSPILRGFATNRILLVVDDVRMNTAIFRSGNVQNVVSVDPFSLQNSEVIFGPASQFYGSDAIGGVLSFTTKNPIHGIKDSLAYEANVALRISTANVERTWHFDFNLGGEKLASFTSLSFNSFGHTKIGKNGPVEYTRPTVAVRLEDKDTMVVNTDENSQLYTAYNQLNALQKIIFTPNKKTQLLYSFQYSQTSDVNRYDRLISEDEYGNLKNAEWFYGPQKWMLNQLKFTRKSNSWFATNYKINIANQHFQESRNSRKFGSDQLNNRVEDVYANSINFDIEKLLKSRFRLNYGAEYVHNLIRSTAVQNNITDGSTSKLSTRYPDGSTWQSAGVYFNAFKKWNVRYKSEAGVRYNYIVTDAVFDTTLYKFPTPNFRNGNQAITGSISHLFKTKTGNIGIITSTAFRAPNIDDLSKVFDSNEGLVIFPNTILKPEYAYNAELNTQQRIGKKIKLSTSLFYTYLDNAIATVNTTFNGADSIVYDGVLSRVQTLENTDFASILGLQINLEYAFTDHLKLASNYTFLQSGFNNQNPVRHITPNFGGTSLTYTRDLLTLTFYSRYNEQFNFNQFSVNERQDAFLYTQDENGDPYSPSWVVFNVRGAYQWTENVAINLGVENLLNKRYRPYSSGITAPGLNVVLALKAQF